VGAVQVDAGRLRSAVTEERRGGQDLWSVEVGLPVLDDDAVAALVEAVAADPTRVSALLAGDLPHDLVEHAEEAGVELVPYGGELAASCTCAAWVDPCPHAVALLLQVGWLVEDDPLVLLHLRGLPREQLLAALHHRHDLARVPAAEAAPDATATAALETAEDAALRAARILELLGDLGDLGDHGDHGDTAELDRLW